MSKNNLIENDTYAAAAIRLVVVQCLQAVLDQGKSLTEVLEQCGVSIPDRRDQRLLSALCYGVLRWYYRLTAFCDRLLKNPMRKRDRDIQLLLLIALFQLMEARTPAYAVVASSVDAVAKLGKRWAKGLVNAVLRNFIRNQEDLMAALQSAPLAYDAFPVWLYDRIMADWPEKAVLIFEASNVQAPMTLRVNTQKISRENYMQALLQQDIQGTVVSAPETAISLIEPCDVGLLPGFEQGWVSVQDAAAQCAAVLLAPQAGERILDACTAPGGKAIHLLETQPYIAHLLAVDVDAKRLSKVRENLQRLVPDWEARVVLKTADLAGEATAWWDGVLFDRILLDVPCSATGVIRRHPDIKHLRKSSDIESLCLLQQQILKRLWPTLVPGGLLVYASCSILKCENELQIQTFLSDHADAALMPLSIMGACARPAGYQIFPQVNGMDGFYYAALIKRVEC